MAYTACGSTRLTASGVVGVSGKPVIVYSFSFLSGASAGVPIFSDGSAGGGTERLRVTGTANQGTITTIYPNGKFFPTGCYLTVDGNTTYVDVDYAQVD